MKPKLSFLSLLFWMACGLAMAQPNSNIDKRLLRLGPQVFAVGYHASSAPTASRLSIQGDEPFVGAGPGAAVYGILVPGLGLKKTSGLSAFLGLAPICYGLVGAGIGGYVVFQQKYEAYHAATEQTEIDAHYKSATFARKVFVYGTSLGAGIWIAQIGLTLSQGIYNNHYRDRAKLWKENAVSLAPSYDPQSKIAALNLHLNF